MKIIKTINQQVVEEVPFDWKELVKDISNMDWFNPEDPDEWDDMVNYLEDKYTYEELDQHRDKIIQVMKDRREEELPEELDYIMYYAVDRLNDSTYNITEQELINWIHEYYQNI